MLRTKVYISRTLHFITLSNSTNLSQSKLMDAWSTVKIKLHALKSMILQIEKAHNAENCQQGSAVCVRERNTSGQRPHPNSIEINGNKSLIFDRTFNYYNWQDGGWVFIDESIDAFYASLHAEYTTG